MASSLWLDIDTDSLDSLIESQSDISSITSDVSYDTDIESECEEERLLDYVFEAIEVTSNEDEYLKDINFSLKSDLIDQHPSILSALEQSFE